MSGSDSTLDTLTLAESCVDEAEVAGLLDSLRDPAHGLDEILQTSSVLSEKYLQSLFSTSLGEQILSVLFPSFSSLFDDILTRLLNIEDTLTTVTYLTTQLQNLIKIIQCIDNTVQQLITIISNKYLSVELRHIFNVPLHTITILKKSYRHCKDSEKLYGNLFKHASGTLGVLFHETYTLQKSIGFVLSKLKFSGEIDRCEETQHHAIQICEGLLEICQIINGMDNMLLGTAWKILLGFISEFEEIVITKLPVHSYISLLCENIQGCVKYTIQLSTQSSHLFKSGDTSTRKAFTRSCKFSIHFLSLLATNCEKYSCYFNEDVYEKIISFVYEIQMYLLPSNFTMCSLEELNESEIQFFSDLFSSIEKILKNLLCQENFMKHFVLTYLHNRILAPNHMYLLLSLCKTFTKDRNIMEKWLESDTTPEEGPIVQIVERIIELFSEESPATSFLCWCLYPKLGQVPALHDTIVMSICALISSSPAHMVFLEDGFIRNMFSLDPYRCMLACDVLTFVCKSSEVLCDQYFSMFHEIILLNNLSTPISFSFITIFNFLRRIFPFISQECSRRFDKKNQSCPEFLHHDTALRFHTSTSFLDTSESLVVMIKACLDGECKLHDLHELNLVFDMVIQRLNMYQNSNADSNVHQKNKMIGAKDDIGSMLFELLSTFNVEFWMNFSDSVILNRFVCLLLQFNKLWNKDLILPKLIEKFLMFFKSNISDVCKMCIVELLLKFCNHTTSPQLQDQVYEMFVNSVSSNKWRVRHSALDVFEVVSRTSDGTYLLEKCAGFPDIAEAIENHLSYEISETLTSCDGMEERRKNFVSSLQHSGFYKPSTFTHSERSLKFIDKTVSRTGDNSIRSKDVVLERLRALNATLSEFEALLSHPTQPVEDHRLKKEFCSTKTLFDRITNLLRC